MPLLTELERVCRLGGAINMALPVELDRTLPTKIRRVCRRIRALTPERRLHAAASRQTVLMPRTRGAPIPARLKIWDRAWVCLCIRRYHRIIHYFLPSVA